MKSAEAKGDRDGTEKPLQVDGDRAHEPLRKCVKRALDHYFEQLDGHDASKLFELVMGEVEVPMLQSVLEHVDGNQTKAAELLGMSRGTLRKKLRQYKLD